MAKHFCVVLAVCALALALVAPACAQNAGAIGMVDLPKAFSEYKTTKTSNTEITGLVDKFKRDLDLRAKNTLLTEAEITELVTLRAKAPPAVEADTKRIDELEKLNKTKEDELNALSQKPDLTDAERARLRELRDLKNRNEAQGKTLVDDMNQQVDKRKDELQDKLNSDLLAAIAKVAQQKGLALVVDKVAVLYGGVDITEDVIKTLNGS